MTGIPMDVWGSVTALALWDTLNFPVMLMLIFVLGRPHPIAHGAAFSLGMLGTHFLGGLAFAAGGASQLGQLLSAIEHQASFILLGVGILMLIMGVMMPAAPGPRPHFKDPGDHSTLGWFIIGIGLTFTKLPIAAAYALAVSQVVEAAPNAAWVWAGVIYYNVMAFLPFFAIWAAFFAWRETSQRYLGEVNALIRDYAARIMKWALVLVGGFLVGNFVWGLVG